MSNKEEETTKESTNNETGSTQETTKENASAQENEIEIPIKDNVKVKDISKLTLEERAKIVTDARNGIQHENYEVIILKNGNTRIVKRKNKPQTLSSKLINQNTTNQNKIYMSDNQLLMEHIIELNNQVNKLMNKHKKLKKKYRSLKNDIYEDVDEVPINQDINKDSNKQEINPEIKPQTIPQTQTQKIPNYRKGWRSYVSYL